MKKFFKKLGDVALNVVQWVTAILVGVSLLGLPVAVFTLVVGWVLKVFGVM